MVNYECTECLNIFTEDMIILAKNSDYTEFFLAPYCIVCIKRINKEHKKELED